MVIAHKQIFVASTWSMIKSNESKLFSKYRKYQKHFKIINRMQGTQLNNNTDRALDFFFKIQGFFTITLTKQLRACSLSVIQRGMRVIPLCFCLRVNVKEKPINLEKTTSIVLSALLLIYAKGYLKILNFSNKLFDILIKMFVISTCFVNFDISSFFNSSAVLFQICFC